MNPVPQLRRFVAAICILAPAVLLLPSPAAPATDRPWMNQSLPFQERAKLLLGRMTLVEKIDMLHGEYPSPYVFYNEPIDRLGIPALTMTDGPAGIRIANPEVNGGRATALPAPIALAATWNAEMAGRYGELLGKEAFSTGHNVLLGPAVDIARVPVAGRVFEAFGEDPYLQRRIALAVTRGIQRNPVVATVKHFNVYNQEADRFSVSAAVGERALQEIYVPPFEAAKEGHAGAVMCSYNRVNAVYTCENRRLLTGVLKRQLGFNGWIMSDFASTPSTVKAARAGLDQEMPFEAFFGEQLLAAVRSGEVSKATINEKVMRILRPMFRLGLFDRPVEIAPIPERKHGLLARRFSQQGIVLLKNTDGALPLSGSKLHSVAVIGADADNASAAGGGSSHVEPTYSVGVLEGIRRRAGDRVRVRHAPGTDPVSEASLLSGPPAIPSSVLAPVGAEPRVHGLEAKYWADTGFDGEPALVRRERQAAVNLGLVFSLPGLNASSLPPVPPELIGTPISVRWRGTLTAPSTGTYRLALTSLGRGRLYIDGKLRVDHWDPHDLSTKSVDLRLRRGDPHTIRVDYVADHPSVGGPFGLIGATAKLGWRHPSDALPPAVRRAADLARRSDVAVVVVRDYETEQSDRPNLSLPNEQDQLINRVVAANPRTIVVLNTGAPVKMPWLARVPAVIEAWYGGQEQGHAIAAVLFGDVNPSGKLPVTFPRNEEQTPVSSEVQYPGVNNVARYTEGIFVGYRGYDRFGIEPLFPFGHGLSYTSFNYGNLRVDGGGRSEAARVSFTVSNTGAVRGSEVAQVYVGHLPTGARTPSKQLAGSARVSLAPGERRRVTVEIAPRSFSYWDTGSDGWATPVGRVPVYVGSSSSDVRLEGSTRVEE